jgi:hypothetical protein
LTTCGRASFHKPRFLRFHSSAGFILSGATLYGKYWFHEMNKNQSDNWKFEVLTELLIALAKSPDISGMNRTGSRAVSDATTGRRRRMMDGGESRDKIVQMIKKERSDCLALALLLWRASFSHEDTISDFKISKNRYRAFDKQV